MKNLKEYKGVMLIYLVLTIISTIWMVGFDANPDVKQVSNEKNIVMNA